MTGRGSRRPQDSRTASMRQRSWPVRVVGKAEFSVIFRSSASVTVVHPHTVNITNPKSQGIFSQKPPTHGNVNKIHPWYPESPMHDSTTRSVPPPPGPSAGRAPSSPPRIGLPLRLRNGDPARRGLGEVGRLALQRKRILAPLHRASNGLPERFHVEAQLSLGGFLPVCIQTRCRRNRTFFVHAAG